MHLRKYHCIFLLLLTAFCSACANGKPDTPPAKVEINVSAALGLKEALTEIQENYAIARPNVKVIYNLAAAGVLQAQIEQGAPADVFISASTRQIDALAGKNLILSGSRKNIVTDYLVLIAPKNSPIPLFSFQDLADNRIIHYAMGEPGKVPAGQYARETLQHFGLWESTKHKAVFCKDVRAALSYVETGNVETGIVFSTIAAHSDKVKIVAIAPTDSHEPVIFHGAVLSRSPRQDIGLDFMNYITSPQSQAIFQKYEFRPLQ